jgi:hypothetical protein
MGRRGMLIGFLWESQKERDDWKDIDVGWEIILNWMLQKWD